MRGVPLFGTLLAAEEDGELRGRRHERAGARGALVCPARRRGLGRHSHRAARRPAAADRRVGAWRRCPTPSCCTRSPLDIEASGEAPGFDALIRSAWRDRGFGDFWGYALVAEGAAEAMIEVGPNSWDLAAPCVVVEEAGGRMTDLHGTRTIHAGNALATDGLLRGRGAAAAYAG